MANKKKNSRSKSDVSLMLVDDHPLWRDTLRKVLEHAGAGRVIAEADDGEHAIVLAKETRPDVVVMDIDLPGVDGIEATEKILRADPDIRVLALSSSDEPPQVIATIKAGAAGYLLKTAGAEELARAVERVYQGEAVLPPTLSDIVLGELRRTKEPVPDARPEPSDKTHVGVQRLTPRELDVLALMAEGRTNKAIGEQLHVGQKSVEAYVRSIYMKLDLEPVPDDNRRVLAVLAYIG